MTSFVLYRYLPLPLLHEPLEIRIRAEKSAVLHLNPSPKPLLTPTDP